MPNAVMLDATPLGKLAHPRPNQEIRDWLAHLLRAGVMVMVPEITDFEVRRSLLSANLFASLKRLDELKSDLVYKPISTSIMLNAADLWAAARRSGRSTADPKELDCDVILAAQAIDAGAIVAMENVGHLARYVEALHWRQISAR